MPEMRAVDKRWQGSYGLTMRNTRHYVLTAAIAAFATGCGSKEAVGNSAAFEKYIAGHQYGSAPDQWIEMKSAFSGNWDRVGAIFGYQDDASECAKAIAGLKRVNYARTYRCTPAQGEPSQ
jgi:hypothetical protein